MNEPRLNFEVCRKCVERHTFVWNLAGSPSSPIWKRYGFEFCVVGTLLTTEIIGSQAIFSGEKDCPYLTEHLVCQQ